MKKPCLQCKEALFAMQWLGLCFGMVFTIYNKVCCAFLVSGGYRLS